MPEDIVAVAKEKMEKSQTSMERDFAVLRAGRANPQVLDRIVVDYYGTPTPINQMANLSTPEPRVLLVSVWDASALKNVEKAIQAADIGINPSNDGKNIRLVFPELTEERRKELCKTVSKRSEEAKVAVRNIRRDANDNIKKQKKEGELTEDDVKSLEDEVQKLHDKAIKKIDESAKEKEKEIMSV